MLLLVKMKQLAGVFVKVAFVLFAPMVTPAYGAAWTEKWEPFQLMLNLLGQKKPAAAGGAVTDTSNISEHNTIKGLSLIGAGFSRTGTKSIERALKQLGYKIYDGISMMEHDHSNRWLEAAEDWKSKGNLTKIAVLLNEIEDLGYTATLDTPMNFFAAPIAELRQSAKVLLSVRDDLHKWVDSLEFVSDTISSRLLALPWSTMMPDMSPFWMLMSFFIDYPQVLFTYPDHKARPVPWFEYVHTNPNFTPEARNAWVEYHKKHQRYLEDNIRPRDRLLVFNVKQGWKPLVPFLNIDKELEKESFPFVNDRSAVLLAVHVMDFIAIGLPIWILVLLWVFMRLIRFAKILLGGDAMPNYSKEKME